MAHFKRHLILGALFAVVFGVSLSAADSGPQIEAQFSVFGTRTYEGLAYMTATSAKPIPVKFYTVELSPLYSYKGDPVLKFYNLTELTAALEVQAAAKKANPSEPAPALNIKPVATCAFQPGMKRAVMLFFPRASTKASDTLCDIFAMDMSDTRVPPGHIVFINASGHEFAAQINAEFVKLNRGISQPFGADKGKVSMKLARLEPELQSAISSEVWKLAKNQRRLCIFFPMNNSNDVLPDARCLVDNSPVEGTAVQTASLGNQP